MNYYRILFDTIVGTNNTGVCLRRWCGGNTWLPIKYIKRDYKYTKGVAYFVPEWLCRSRGLQGKKVELYHHPPKINPKYNQEALDDLKC